MCAILDANVVGNVFGENRTSAGKQFYDWLNTPKGRLAVGGKLYKELLRNGEFQLWVKIALRDGRVRRFTSPQVEEMERSVVEAGPPCKSNDKHVIALARVSGARILYTQDAALSQDFKNSDLIPRPRGRILPTQDSPNAKRQRRRLLNQTDLCRTHR